MNKKRIFIYAFSIFAFMIMLGGVSYAYFIENKLVATVTLETGQIAIEITGNANYSTNGAVPMNLLQGESQNNYISFNVVGKTDTESIVYDVDIVSKSGNTIPEEYVYFYLTDNNDNYISGPITYADMITNKKATGKTLFESTFTAGGTYSEVTRSYRLRVWVDASFEVDAQKNFDFDLKLYAENGTGQYVANFNVMDLFPTAIQNVKTTITRAEFVNMDQEDIDEAYDAASVKADLTYDNHGSVKAWVDGTTLYIAADGQIHLKNCYDTTNDLGLFQGFTALTYIDFGDVDTSLVTTMQKMFRDCNVLDNLNLSMFNTSNVTSMAHLFFNCFALETLDITGFNTSNVTSMNGMFYHCENLLEADLSGFDTSKVTTMIQMFWYDYRLQEVDLSSFNTSNVGNMAYMFGWCKALTTLNLSNFDTSNVTTMYQMFHHAIALQTLYIDNFDTSNVENMGYMFNYCQALTVAYTSHFDTRKVTTMAYMFNHCDVITQIDISSFRTSLVTDMSYMFSNCAALARIYFNASLWSTSAVTNSTNMFSGSTSLVGQARTAYDSNYVDKTYARSDIGTNKGYFWYSAEIPREYQKLLYITGTGTQYIDTGYVPNASNSIIITFAFTSTDANQRLFGVTGDLQYNFYINSSTKFVYNYANTTSNNVNTNVTANTSRYVLRMNRDGKVTIGGNGSVYNQNISGNATNTANANLFLFARSTSAGVAGYFSKARIYNVLIYDGSTLVRQYVPCFLKSDISQTGLYEIRTGTFLPNAAGGTTFSRGTYINP